VLVSGGCSSGARLLALGPLACRYVQRALMCERWGELGVWGRGRGRKEKKKRKKERGAGGNSLYARTPPRRPTGATGSPDAKRGSTSADSCAAVSKRHRPRPRPRVGEGLVGWRLSLPALPATGLAVGIGGGTLSTYTERRAWRQRTAEGCTASRSAGAPACATAAMLWSSCSAAAAGPSIARKHPGGATPCDARASAF